MYIYIYMYIYVYICIYICIYMYIGRVTENKTAELQILFSRFLDHQAITCSCNPAVLFCVSIYLYYALRHVMSTLSYRGHKECRLYIHTVKSV